MSHALRRVVPLGAAVLGFAALPGPALAAGVVAPGGEVIYNTASITLSNFPNAATPITVRRDGATIATAVANVGAVGGTPGTATLNVPGLVGVGHILDCWTGFTPDILPGDVIGVGGAAASTITAPDFSVSNPGQAGSELVTTGKAADAAGNPMANVQGNLFSPLTRFSAGNKGGQLVSGAVFFNAGSATYTTRFAGLTPGDMAIGLTSRSQIVTLPPAGVAGGLTIGAENGVPGPVPGCTAPLGSDAVTGANTKTVNIANAGQALTITGTTDPNVKSVTLNVGGSTVPATLAGGTWSATLSPANLPDGALTAAARFTSATGTYHGRTMNLVKDTVAPGAVSASVPSGAYDTARSVALSAEPGATIHYTTDASDPTASSRTFGDAIAVGQAQSIKAVAVDAAGNTGPVAQFDYAINPPATQHGSSKPAPVVVPKLRLDSLDATRSIGLRSVRRHGMQLTIQAPEGTKIVRIRVLRGSRRIDEVTSKMSKDGVLVVNLPHTRKARRALKRGTYQVLVTPGRSSQDLGVTTVRTFKVR